ncbi:hypothetical protein [Erwinia phage vB_Ea277G]|nr:hypothetical protein [Erwinia phage vB_Ea277G]
MRIKEVTKEEFFKYLEKLDDCPDCQLSASNWGEVAKDEHGDVVLTLAEVKAWYGARFFVRTGEAYYEHLYVVRLSDEDDSWEDKFSRPNTHWYHFQGNCWTGDKSEPWPFEMSLHMHGEHVNMRRTVIFEGSGYDEDRPFEDLVKVMGDLANVYRLVGLSEVEYRDVELRLEQGLAAPEWKYFDKRSLNRPLAAGTKVYIDDEELTVHYETRQMGGGHGEGRWMGQVVTLKNRDGAPVNFYNRLIKAKIPVDTRRFNPNR